jgi:hypothetical protein
MHARQCLMGIAAALAIGLVLLQPPSAAMAERGVAEEQLKNANEPEFSDPLQGDSVDLLRSKSLDRK